MYRDVERNVKKKILYVTLFSVTVLAILWVWIGTLRRRSNQTTVKLGTGWTMVVDGVKSENVDLGSFDIRGLKRLSTIDMYKTLPKDVDGGYTASILVYLSSVEAFIDGREIYSYGTYDVENDLFCGSGYHFLIFPYEVSGKELHIRIVCNEDNPFTGILPLRCEPSPEAGRIFADNLSVSFFVNTFILILGVVLMITGVMVLPFNKGCYRIILIGLFAFLVGHWSNCQGKVYEVFSSGLTFASKMEYLSLYFAPAPLAWFIWAQTKHKEPWREIMLRYVSISVTVFPIMATVLHYTNVLRFPRTLVCFHVFGATALALICVAGITFGNRRRAYDLSISAAFAILGLAVIFDLLRFNIQKYLMLHSEQMLEISFLPLGTLLFIIYLLASYLIYLYDRVISNAEKEALTRLAYHDTLTGLYNRAKSQEALDELDQNDSAVALVNFDVNGLKFVNDNFGHDEGDNLLKTVAEVMQDCFENIGNLYRLSGDEFLAIISPEGIFTLNQQILQFEKTLKNISKERQYVLSVSYGVSYRNQGEHTTSRTLYNDADEKMYEVKMKSEYSRRAKENKLLQKKAVFESYTKHESPKGINENKTETSETKAE